MKPKWFDLVFAGTKTLELRSTPCKLHANSWVAVVVSGTGEIRGAIFISGSEPLSEQQLVDREAEHCCSAAERAQFEYKNGFFGWSISRYKRFAHPVAGKGQLGFAKLSAEQQAACAREMAL